MLLFSFLFLVLLLVSYCMYTKNSKVVPVIVIGVLSAIFVCAFKTLFLFAHRVVPYNFINNYVYLMVRQSLLPVIILYCVFFVISKDSMEYKIEVFFPLELSFYAVFLPHIIISTSEGLYSGFSLFVKPLLFAAMLVQLSILMKWFYNSIQKKNIVFMILFGIMAVVYICLPGFFETMSLLKINVVLLIAGCSVYCMVPVLSIALTALKKINL